VLRCHLKKDKARKCICPVFAVSCGHQYNTTTPRPAGTKTQRRAGAHRHFTSTRMVGRGPHQTTNQWERNKINRQAGRQVTRSKATQRALLLLMTLHWWHSQVRAIHEEATTGITLMSGHHHPLTLRASTTAFLSHSTLKGHSYCIYLQHCR